MPRASLQIGVLQYGRYRRQLRHVVPRPQRRPGQGRIAATAQHGTHRPGRFQERSDLGKGHDRFLRRRHRGCERGSERGILVGIRHGPPWCGQCAVAHDNAGRHDGGRDLPDVLLWRKLRGNPHQRLHGRRHAGRFNDQGHEDAHRCRGFPGRRDLGSGGGRRSHRSLHASLRSQQPRDGNERRQEIQPDNQGRTLLRMARGGGPNRQQGKPQQGIFHVLQHHDQGRQTKVSGSGRFRRWIPLVQAGDLPRTLRG
mmetsp:Transcript_7466/g.16064  ORF Transcript_7466/g.16064 Transcript_7466/m.16064 type:complete len:255 (-) Transcript_7466:700-1464(-)